MSGALTLIAIGLLSGVVTGLSPCVLPVLPVVLATSAVTPLGVAAESEAPSASRWRPYLVVGGLVTSFALFTLVGSALLAAIGLPQDFLRKFGIVAMIAVGIGFLVPAVAHWIERPFAHVPEVDARRQSSAFLFGAVYGLVFVPCAGPVLATITVLAASRSVGWELVLLTVAFAIGVAIPLLFVAVAGQRMTQRVAGLRRRMPLIRRITGVVLIATGFAVAFNITDVFQRLVPGYVSATQTQLETSQAATRALAGLSHRSNARSTTTASSQSLDSCALNPKTLQECGTAPALQGISAWLNTPGDRPLSIRGLRGHVVLVDFWTYSCINCQRTLPYLEAWDRAYRNKGLVIIGVHSPEFAFEHVVSNVRSQAKSLGVTYPIAVDDAFTTWNAYYQQYWPAHYLIDRRGVVRQVHYGEGEYGTTEKLIRTLLQPKTASLPPPTSVNGVTITANTTPETYLGSDRGASYVNLPASNSSPETYELPQVVGDDRVGLGGNWSMHPQYIAAGARAQLVLNYRAARVYLVLGGSGTVTVTDGSSRLPSISVSGAPTLYEVRQGPAHRALLHLTFSPGVRAYSFTFG